jgi:hypothetical protein
MDAPPATPADLESLHQLWGSLRHEKELKEAKSRPKVQSLEAPDPPGLVAVPKQHIKKRKSMYVKTHISRSTVCETKKLGQMHVPRVC